MDNANTNPVEKQAQTQQAIELPREIIVRALQNEVYKHGTEAQKGSKIGADKLLDLVQDLKSDPPLLKDVLDGLNKEKFAKVKSNKDGSPGELIFDQKLPGYPKSVVKVDVSSQNLNGKSAQHWDRLATKEKQEFLDARIDAKNRPLPEGMTGPMSKEEKLLTRSIEHNLVANDLKSIIKTFQTQPNNAAQWQRVIAEVSSDFPETTMKYGTGPDGKPYLGIQGNTFEYEDLDDYVIIPAQGAPYSIEMDDMGEPDFKRNLNKAPEAVLAAQTPRRVEDLEQKSYDYRCDFDQQETRKSAGVPYKTVVEKYNSYDTKFCGDEAVH